MKDCLMCDYIGLAAAAQPEISLGLYLETNKL
jgi:hypothetical protein